MVKLEECIFDLFLIGFFLARLSTSARFDVRAKENENARGHALKLSNPAFSLSPRQLGCRVEP